MTKNLFLKPLINFPDSIIEDATTGKSYTYAEFYELFQPIAAKLLNAGIMKNSIVVIFAFKNAFDTLKLFYACLQNHLIPFIVEAGSFDSTKDLAYTGIFMPTKIGAQSADLSISFSSHEEIEINFYLKKSDHLFIG